MKKSTLINTLYYIALLTMAGGTMFLVSEALEFHKDHTMNGISLIFIFAIGICAWAFLTTLKMKNISAKCVRGVRGFSQ